MSHARRRVRRARLDACLYAALAWAVSAPEAARLVHDSIPGPYSKTRVRFTVALPDDYAPARGPYPVVYHLHGLGGDEQGFQTVAVPRAFEAARARGLIGPVLVVFPDGLANSMWADSKDMAKPAETRLIRELIPHIDSAYPTRAGREGRFIQGFSMGGFGAAKCLAKFPELFRAATLYDGALLDWPAMQSRHPGIVQEMFAGDSAYFAGFSPFDLLRKHAAAIGPDFPVKMAVGSLSTFNRAFRDSLKAHGLRPHYVETGCGHALPCLLDSAGEEAARLYGTLLGGKPAMLLGGPPSRPGPPVQAPGAGSLAGYDLAGRTLIHPSTRRVFPSRRRPLPAERSR